MTMPVFSRTMRHLFAATIFVVFLGLAGMASADNKKAPTAATCPTRSARTQSCGTSAQTSRKPGRRAIGLSPIERTLHK